MKNDRESAPTVDREDRVTLAPLSLGEALSGLLSIPDPDATKPKHKKAASRKADEKP